MQNSKICTGFSESRALADEHGSEEARRPRGAAVRCHRELSRSGRGRVVCRPHGIGRLAALALVLFSFVLAPAVAAASGSSGKGKAGARGLPRGQMLAVLRIAEQLDLDDAETIRMAGEFRKAHARNRQLQRERKAKIAEIEVALERDPTDTARLEALTGQLAALQREIALAPEALFEEVGTMLDVQQRARLAVIKDRLRRQIEKETQRRRAARKAKTEKRGK